MLKKQNQQRKDLQKESSRFPLQKEMKQVISQPKKSIFHQQKREGAMDHENTMLGKPDGSCDEEKLKTDTIIPTELLDRPSPLKVYRHQDFEKVGRLSRNRAKDLKGTWYCLSLNFFVLKIYTLYTWSFFSYGTNQKRRDLVQGQLKETIASNTR